MYRSHRIAPLLGVLFAILLFLFGVSRLLAAEGDSAEITLATTETDPAQQTFPPIIGRIAAAPPPPSQTVTITSTTGTIDWACIGASCTLQHLYTNRGADGIISFGEVIEAINNDWQYHSVAGHIVNFALDTPGAINHDGDSYELFAPHTTIDGDQTNDLLPDVRIDGPFNAHSLVIYNHNVTLRNLSFTGLSLDGVDAHHATINNNYIGLDIDGTTTLSDAPNGIEIEGGAHDNLIHDNLIAGGTHSSPTLFGTGITIFDLAHTNQIVDNIFGMDKNQASKPNEVAIAIDNSFGNEIGVVGRVSADCTTNCNLIVNSTVGGIIIQGSNATGNKVTGNFIGTTPNGTSAAANQNSGITLRNGARQNTIGGSRVGTVCDGACNLISGNQGHGVSIEGSTTQNNTVSGNFIGTNIAGSAALPNTSVGVFITASVTTTIGASVDGSTCIEGCNLVSGNGTAGIWIGGGATNTSVFGNFVGTQISGTATLGNGISGITIKDASGNAVGGTSSAEGNRIGGNGEGVFLLRDAANPTDQNTIRYNTFHNTQAPLIDHFPELGYSAVITGPNAGKQPPIIQSIATQGANTIIRGFALPDDIVDLYGAAGQTYLTHTVVGDNGRFTVTLTTAPAKPIIAIATDIDGNTSEFSRPVDLGLNAYAALPETNVFAYVTMSETHFTTPEAVTGSGQFYITIDGEEVDLLNDGNEVDFGKNDDVFTGWFTTPVSAGTYDVGFHYADVLIGREELTVTEQPRLLILTDYEELFKEFVRTDASKANGIYGAVDAIAQYADAEDGVVIDVRQEIDGYASQSYATNRNARIFLGNKIDQYIHSLNAYQNTLKYLAIVGDDAVIPSYRRTDPTGKYEKPYPSEVGGTRTNPPLLDSAAGYVLSDVPYASFDGTSPNSVAQPKIDMAFGRIFHATPQGLSAAITAYQKPLLVRDNNQPAVVFYQTDETNGGRKKGLDWPKNYQTTFVPQLTAKYGTTLNLNSAATLPATGSLYAHPGMGNWNQQTVNRNMPRAAFSMLLSHANQQSNATAVGNSSLTAANVRQMPLLDSRLVLNTGCHSGYPLTRVGSPDLFINGLPAAFLDRHAAYLAPTTYGLTINGSPQYHDRIYNGFINQLLHANTVRTIGDAQRGAFQRYHATRPTTGTGGATHRWDKWDTYSLYGIAYFGLPTQCVNCANPPAPRNVQRRGTTQATHTFDIDFSTQTFTRQTDLNGAVHFELPVNGQVSGVAGYPLLPETIYQYQLPAGATVNSISLGNTTTIVESSIVAFKRAAPLSRTYGELAVEPVTLSANYPSQIYWHTTTELEEGVLLTVGINPLQYDPQNEQVTLYQDVELTVSYDAPSADFTPANLTTNNGNPITPNLGSVPFGATINASSSQAVSLTWRILDTTGNFLHVEQSNANLNSGANPVSLTTVTNGWPVGAATIELSVGINGATVASVSEPFSIVGNSVSLSADRATYYDEPATLTARVFDETGAPVTGLTPDLLWNNAFYDYMTEVEAGVYQSQFATSFWGAGVHQFEVQLAGGESAETALTVDQTPPIATMRAYTGTAGSGFSVIPVDWSGYDNESDVDYYELEYAVGSGAWQAWFTRTAALDYYDTQTQAFFGDDEPVTVSDGETYHFRVRAVDFAGNVGSYDDASTTVTRYAPLDRNDAQAAVIHQTNLYRQSLGLPPLKHNSLLDDAAMAHSWDISQRNLGGHVGSDGSSEGDRVARTGYVWSAVAENVAAGQTSPTDVMDAWINSPAHQANLASPLINEIGVGYIFEPDWNDSVHWWVQNFGRRDDHYPVIIDLEATTTNSTSVALYLYGTGWATEMQVSNDPAFGGATWQPFSPNVNWTLDGGSGERTVYIKLRNATGDELTAQDSIWLNTAAPSGVNLALTKTDAPDPVENGGTLTYTLALVNNGGSPATGVHLIDALPAGVTVRDTLASQGFCSTAAQTVTCFSHELAAGERMTATLVVDVAPAVLGTLTNHAHAIAHEDPTGDSASTTTTVVQSNSAEIDLTLTKTESADPAPVDAPLTYTLVVTNNGPFIATDVTLTDTLPSGITAYSASAGCSGSPVVVCPLGTLYPSASSSVQLVITPTTPATLTNAATVSANESETNPADNSDTITTTVQPAVDLAVSIDATPAQVNQSLTFSFTVSNLSAYAANNVQLAVASGIADNVSFVGNSAECSYDNLNDSFTCTFPTIGANSSAVGTLTVTPNAAANINNGTFYVVPSGTAVVSSNLADPLPANNSASLAVPLRFAGDDRWSAQFSPAGVDGAVDDVAVLANGEIIAVGDFYYAGGAATKGIGRFDGTAWDNFDSFGVSCGFFCNGDIETIVADGNTLYLGGNFNEFYDSSGDSQVWDGVVAWENGVWRDVGGGIDGTVTALAVAPNGDLIVGGDFTDIGGVTVNNIARWDGAQWHALGVGLNLNFAGEIKDILIDGSTIYVVGDFETAGGNAAYQLAIWNGAAWSSPLTSYQFGELNALAHDGSNLYVGGNFSEIDGIPVDTLAMWNGATWSAVGSVPFVQIDDLAFYDGDLFAANGSVIDAALARWDGNTWGVISAENNVRALTVGNGNLIAAGTFDFIDTIGAASIAQFDGTRWQPLRDADGGHGLNREVDAMALLDDGRIVVGGRVSSIQTAGDTLVAAGDQRVTAMAVWDGAAWSSLGSITWANTNLIAPEVDAIVSDGNDIYIGGLFDRADGQPVSHLAHWNDCTQAWEDVGGGVSGSTHQFDSLRVNALALDGDKLYVAGRFETAGGVPANNIARFHRPTQTWHSLGNGIPNHADTHIYALAVDPATGDLYVGGNFSEAGIIAANFIARWDGAQWHNLGTGVRGIVTALKWHDGDLYVGGNFDEAGGVAASLIARWDGANWHALGGGVLPHQTAWRENPVQSIDIDTVTGDVIVAGDFDAVDGGNVTAAHLARWDGANWHALAGGAIDRLSTGTRANGAIVRGDDLYVDGFFVQAGHQAANWFGRYALRTQVGADLRVSVCVSAENATQDDTVSYAITVHNDGESAAANVQLTDTLPTGFTLTGSSCGGAACSLGTLNAGTMATVYLTGTLDVAGYYTNSVTVSSSTSDPFSANNSAMVRHHADGLSGADLRVEGSAMVTGDARELDVQSELSVATDRVAPFNTAVTYQFTVTNDGPDSASGVVLTLVLPTEGALISADSACTGTTCVLGTLANGASRTVAVVWQTPNKSAELPIRATVSASSRASSDDDPLNNQTTIATVAAHNHESHWNARFGTPQIVPDWTTHGVEAMATVGESVYFSADSLGPLNNFILRWDGKRVNSDIGGGTSERVTSMVAYDDDLIAGGYFGTAGDQTSTAMKLIARFDPASETWHPLGRGLVGNNVWEMVVDGSDIYVVGSFTHAVQSDGTQIAVNNIARWDGSQWHALGGGANGNQFAVAVVGTYVYVGGEFTSLRVWNKTTAQWEQLGGSFNTFLSGIIWSLEAVGTDLYVGGWFSDVTQPDNSMLTVNNIARWDGANWHALGAGTGDTVYKTRFHDGNLFVGGAFIQVEGNDAHYLAAFDPTTQTWTYGLGSPYSIANTLGNSAVKELAVLDDELLVGGLFEGVGGELAVEYIARWTGSEWRSLGDGMRNVTALAQNERGEVVAAGSFTQAGGVDANGIAIWNGFNWRPLNAGISLQFGQSVETILPVGNDLYVGGNFAQADGTTVNNIAFWDDAAMQWSALAGGVGDQFSTVKAIVQHGDNLFVGGYFSDVDNGNVAASGIARYHIPSSTWHALGSNNVWPDALAVIGDDLYVGGEFTSIDGVATVNLARWDIINETWHSVVTGMGNVNEFGRTYINGLTPNGDKLIIDGAFTTITTPNRGTVSASYIVQLNTATQAWESLGDGMVVGAFAKPAVAPDGSIYILGEGINAGGGSVAGDVSRWDGTRWSSIGGNDGVGALLALEHDIFTGGLFEHYRTNAVDIDVTLGAEPLWGYLNEPLTLTVRIDNPSSTPASLVTVREQLPASFVFDYAVGDELTGCHMLAGLLHCHLSEVAASGGVTVSLVVTPTQLGTFAQSAEITTSSREYNFANNSDDFSITIVERGTIPLAVEVRSAEARQVALWSRGLVLALFVTMAFVISVRRLTDE